MMKRRSFIATGLATGLGLPLVSKASWLKNLEMKTIYANDIGIQVYTVRDQIAQDMEGTIKKIAQLGYHQLEAGSLDQLTEMAPIAKDQGLKIKSAFFSWFYLTGRWDIAEKVGMMVPENQRSEDLLIEKAQQHGLTYLVFGYLTPQERKSLDDYKKIAENLNKFGEKCQKAGISLCYHNHSFEFEKLGSQTPYDLLIAETDPALLFFELDVFWASLGGYDPSALMKKMKGRIKLMHLKDIKPDSPVIFNEQVVPKDTFKELGKGVLKMDAIIQLAEKHKVEQCMVEQDHSPNPLASIETSINYVKNL